MRKPRKIDIFTGREYRCPALAVFAAVSAGEIMKRRLVFFVSFVLAVSIRYLLAVLTRFDQHNASASLSNFFVGMFDKNALIIRTDYDPYNNREITKAIMAFPSHGCQHYFEHGGCAMCGFNQGIEAAGLHHYHPFALTVLTEIYLLFLEKYLEDNRITPDALIVFMAGSFLNIAELPLSAQELIFDFFRRSGIRRLVIESRPEHILRNRKRLVDYARRLSDRKLEIAIGLETVDCRIRNKTMNKRMSLQDYEDAIRVIKGFGGIASTYILIGAPCLSEGEMVDAAVTSTEFAWKTGSEIVYLETYCVQAATPWAGLYRTGWLKIPSLWNIIEVLRRIDRISHNWYLGEFTDWPPPVATPVNCPECTDSVIGILDNIRKKHDMGVLDELPPCDCRNHE